MEMLTLHPGVSNSNTKDSSVQELFGNFAGKLSEEWPDIPQTKLKRPGLLKLKSAFNKIKAKRELEKDAFKRLMKGRETSHSSGFHWYIEPYSAKYTMLRYSRAVCI